MIHNTGSSRPLRTPLLRIALLVTVTILLQLPGVPGVSSAVGQALYNAENGGMGGGGTAYIRGFHANFINPANLYLIGHGNSVDLGIGQTAIYAEPVYPVGGIREWGEYIGKNLLPYEPGRPSLGNARRQEILETRFPGNRAVSRNFNRLETVLAGVRWHSGESAYSLVLRARQGSRIETGKGWYTTRFNEDGRELTLLHQKETLYELSAGFAHEFTFVNGLFPGTNRLFVGLAPKAILGGALMDIRYEGRYSGSSESGDGTFEYRYSHNTSGDYTGMTRRYRSGETVSSSIGNTLKPLSSLSPSGWGVGLDFGLTYAIPFDNTQFAEKRPIPRTGPGLYLALSVTDLGVMRYSRRPYRLFDGPSEASPELQGIAVSAYTGADGQFLEYLDRLTEVPNPLADPDSISSGTLVRSLPTSVNSGMMIEFGRLRLAGDITLGLANTAFTTKRPSVQLGAELRPLIFLPLRAGAQIVPGRPVQWTLGSGVETASFALTFSARFLSLPGGGGIQPVGGAFGGLRYHF